MNSILPIKIIINVLFDALNDGYIVRYQGKGTGINGYPGHVGLDYPIGGINDQPDTPGYVDPEVYLKKLSQ